MVAGIAISKDIGESKTRYCKSCKMKHLVGKYTAEGKLRYKQFLASKKNGGRRNRTAVNKTVVVEDVGGRARKQRKCFMCRKEHFPYCKSERGVCNVCKKRHQPFCRRKQKVKQETSHPVADTSDIKQKLKGLSLRKKRELAASIVANFEELFWVTDGDFSNNADVDIGDEDVETDVVTTVAFHDPASDVIGTEDTGDPEIEVGLGFDDDVSDDHVAEMNNPSDADDQNYLSAAKDVLASDLGDAVAVTKVDDDVLNDHVLDNEDILLAEAVAETVGSSLNTALADVVNEDDDTSTMSIRNDNNFAGHVLVCASGAAGLLPVRLGIEPRDTAADDTEVDETSVSDVFNNELTFTLRQETLGDINCLNKCCRDNHPGCTPL